jgi:hypothetical protein
MNTQDEAIKIHSKYGTTEKANYEIQLLCEKYAKEYHEQQLKILNIPDVTNRTYSVDEVKILLEKQKQACANEFIHGEMSMELAKRKVLQTPIVSF